MYFILNHWPLWFISLAMVAAAVIDGWKLKVPNWLTFPLVLSGWTLGLAAHVRLLTSATGVGDIWASLAATALGFILLFPVYAVGGMGAGDVKMQMGFGAWVGAFYGFASGLWIVFCAFCLAVVIGGVIATGMILVRGKFAREPGQHARHRGRPVQGTGRRGREGRPAQAAHALAALRHPPLPRLPEFPALLPLGLITPPASGVARGDAGNAQALGPPRLAPANSAGAV